jgi:hypothetical protein
MMKPALGRPQLAALLCGWELAKGMVAEAVSAKREREEPVESVRLSKRARKALPGAYIGQNPTIYP